MRKNKGQALVVAYLVIAFFLAISAALIGKSFTEKGIAMRNQLSTEAFYLAEGAIENTISQFTYQIANYQIPPSIASFSVNTVFSTFGGATVTTNVTRMESNDRVITDGQTTLYVCNYEFIATARHPQNNNIAVTVHEIIARRLIPTFQHAVFYNDDLEVLPGQNMDLTGRIHSNHDMYLDSKATLRIYSSSLHSAGDILNKRKDTHIPDPGPVKILVKGSNPQTLVDMNIDSTSPSWQADAITTWNGGVQSSVHGVTSLTAPSVGSIQPNGYYNNNADTNGVVVSMDGINIQVKRSGLSLQPDKDYPADAVTATSGTTFKNNRENKSVTMVNINLGRFANADGTAWCPNKNPPGPCPNNLPPNGLLYATVKNTGGNEPGVRLAGGSLIKNDSGLTVVSNDPVYVQGNYNTGNINPTGAEVLDQQRPSSVICDSLNLLSNQWTDPKSKQNLDNRTPSETTFNAAFIAGVDTTTNGQYNGGLENYPRLHEDWSQNNPITHQPYKLTIKGSFVELWNSSIANKPWVYGAPYYTAPTRSWSYDTRFNDATKLPPFTPWAVEAQRIAWWRN